MPSSKNISLLFSQGCKGAGWERSGSLFLKASEGSFEEHLEKPKPRANATVKPAKVVKWNSANSGAGALRSSCTASTQGSDRELQCLPSPGDPPQHAHLWTVTSPKTYVVMVIAWKGKDQGLETPLLPVHFTFFKQACGKAAEHQSKWAVLVTGQSPTKPPQEGIDSLHHTWMCWQMKMSMVMTDEGAWQPPRERTWPFPRGL